MRGILGLPRNGRGTAELGSWVEERVLGVQSRYQGTPHLSQPSFAAEVTGSLRGLQGLGREHLLEALDSLEGSGIWCLTSLEAEARGS